MELISVLSLCLAILSVLPILYPKLFSSPASFIFHKNAVLILSGFIIGNTLTALLLN